MGKYNSDRIKHHEDAARYHDERADDAYGVGLEDKANYHRDRASYHRGRSQALAVESPPPVRSGTGTAGVSQQ